MHCVKKFFLWCLIAGLPLKSFAQFEILDFEETGALINQVSSIYVAGNGQAWIGTSADGLHFVNGDTWTSHSSGVNGFPNDYVARVKFVDAKVIVTTRFNGAAYFNGSGWTAWSVPSQIMDSEVRDVEKDGQGNIWFPTYQGISRDSTATGIWKNFTTTNFPAMPTNYFHNVFVDTNNDKWFGSQDEGIFILRAGSVNSQVYTTSDGLPSNHINKVMKVGSDYWVATGNGLAILSGSVWTIHNSANNSAFTGVTQVKDMVRTPEGHVYLATDNGLVFRRGSTWSRVDNSSTNLPTNNLTAIGYDQILNELWIGTATSGVAKIAQSNQVLSSRNASADRMLLYPNPVSDHLMIEGLPSSLEIISMELLNVEGMEVLHFQQDQRYDSSTIRLEIPASLRPGLYLLKLETTEGPLTKKILKQ